MKIFVENLTKKRISIELNRCNKIIDIKTKILKIEGIKPENQYLTFEGQELNDNNTLNYYSIQDNSTIFMTVRLGFKIFIESSTREKFKIESKPIQSISTIKEIIEHQEGIPHNNKKLFFNGMQLENDKRLLDYDIESNSTLQLSFE